MPPRALLAPTGRTLWVAREEDPDAVTALSGSGPPTSSFVEAMMRAAQMGPVARARQTARAFRLRRATALAQASSEPPDVLRERVPPGGTTYAALTSMEASGVEAAPS